LTDGYIGLFNVPGNTDDRDELLTQFNNTSWAKYAMIEDFNTGTDFRESGTLIVADGTLKLPTGYNANTAYTYVSSGLALDGSDSVSKSTTILDYERDSGCHVKFEVSYNNGSNYYTWLDTSTSTDVLRTEKTSSQFTAGNTIKTKITITTPASGTDKATINFYGVLTDPDLFA
tara:strand:- start:4935 stop:5456 length:522 start_codon:yes stop_codon:yes gene_type:complete